MNKHPWIFTANDQKPPLAFEYTDQDLTGYTIYFRMLRPDGTVLQKTATPIDLTIGKGEFRWAAGDLQPGYSQLCEIEFVDPEGQNLTSPQFLIDVKEELG